MRISFAEIGMKRRSVFQAAGLAAFLVLGLGVQAVSAATFYGPYNAVINGLSPEAVSAALDMTGYENLSLSFDFEGEGLDTGDSFSYYWRSGFGPEHLLGSFAGINEGIDGDETDSVTVALPLDAVVTDLELVFRAFVNTNNDTVNLTNVTLSADALPVVECSPQYGVVGPTDVQNISTGEYFDSIQDAIADCDTTDGDTVVLHNDIETTSQVTILKEITLDGQGHVLAPIFVKTSNSNNAAIGIIDTDNVTVQNLEIDGSGGTDLHGINVYVSDNVVIDAVASNFNRSGLVVNGSTVDVTNFSSEGNIWHGINVDQGGGVTSPAVLTIHGVSTHGEFSPTTVPHILVDNTAENVTVNDVDGQYWYKNYGAARAYTLKPTAEIITPAVDEVVFGDTKLSATYKDFEGVNDEEVDWAVRAGTCAASTGTVFGNVDGHHDAYDWVDGHDFSAVFGVSSVAAGKYCFVFNPREEAASNQPNIRLTRQFWVGALSATPEMAYNPTYTEHTVTASVGVPVAGVNLLAEVTGANPSVGTLVTNAAGEADFTYLGEHAGIDTITICVDDNENEACDDGEVSVEVFKQWMQYYVTGGAHVKDERGKKNVWGWNGSVGELTDGTLAGHFKVQDFENKDMCQFTEFSDLSFGGEPTLSPASNLNQASFTATGSCKSGEVVEVVVVITDVAEPGKDADTIEIVGGGLDFSGVIEGGNFQIHPPEMSI